LTAERDDVNKKQEQLLQEAITPKFDNSQLTVDTDAYDEMYQLAEGQMNALKFAIELLTADAQKTIRLQDSERKELIGLYNQLKRLINE
jgi:hypothetical protein